MHANAEKLRRERDAALAHLNALGEGTTPPNPAEYERARGVYERARKAALRCCPTCGGPRSERDGLRDYQCAGCTAHDESAY